MAESIADVIPGSFDTLYLSGGTRQGINYNRPWQVPLESMVDPVHCPICNKPQEEFPLPEGSPEGWRVLPNIRTPHDNQDHLLVVPNHCWSPLTLQRWGGPEKIGEALDICRRIVREREQESALLVNVGPYTGGSLGHPHMHIFPALPSVDFRTVGFLEDPRGGDSLVFENDDYVVRANGARSGECQIVPKQPMEFTTETILSLAKALGRVIDVGNRIFRSKPLDFLVSAADGRPIAMVFKNAVEALGLDMERFGKMMEAGSRGMILIEQKELLPNFGLVVRISASNRLMYADYCPVLNQWGPTEFVLPTMEGSPYVLPWDHQTTAKAFRSA